MIEKLICSLNGLLHQRFEELDALLSYERTSLKATVTLKFTGYNNILVTNDVLVFNFSPKRVYCLEEIDEIVYKELLGWLIFTNDNLNFYGMLFDELTLIKRVAVATAEPYQPVHYGRFKTRRGGE